MIRNFQGMSLQSISIILISVLLTMSIHETAHGLVSYWLGDPTAKRAGRISLNPFHHIDWYGLICLLLFGFGWAKPVPVDSSYYKDEKTGIIWTAFAGPVSNFLLAFVNIGIYCALVVFVPRFVFTGIGSYLLELLRYSAILSAGFGIFNLIPIPPLDGSRIFWSFLPWQTYRKWMNPPAIIQIVLMLVIFSGLLSRPLGMMQSTVISWFVDFWSVVFIH